MSAEDQIRVDDGHKIATLLGDKENLLAEVAQLRVEHARCEEQAESFCQIIERLGGDVARLRAALKEIAATRELSWHVVEIARDALEPK
jgi:hypothetical protein